jgi:1,2-phenylacetyl-CoA epoxidase catalytic subunit
MDRTILIGADDVLHGGRLAQSAGEDMCRAASTIQSALETHQRFLEEWMMRFEKAVQETKEARDAE